MTGMTDTAGTSPEVVVVTTTCPDNATANRIAVTLVERRLAACVQLSPLTSVYRWEGDVVTEGEVALAAKTPRRLGDEATRCIREAHPYELPEILVSADVEGDDAYLAWVVAETAR